MPSRDIKPLDLSRLAIRLWLTTKFPQATMVPDHARECLFCQYVQENYRGYRPVMMGFAQLYMDKADEYFVAMPTWAIEWQRAMSRAAEWDEDTARYRITVQKAIELIDLMGAYDAYQ